PHVDRAVVGLVQPDPPENARRRSGRGRDPEHGLGEAGHQDVALDPPAPVQALRPDDRAHGPVDVVGAEPLEEPGRPRARDVEPPPGGRVEQADPLPHRAVLRRDPLEVARPPPRPLVRALPAAGPARHEVVRALPAVVLAEHGPELLEPRVERTRPERPAPLSLVAREPERVIVAVDLARLLGDVSA